MEIDADNRSCSCGHLCIYARRPLLVRSSNPITLPKNKKTSARDVFLFYGVAKDLIVETSFLLQKYVQEKLGIEEISRQIFSSPSTVLKYLKLYDIPARKVGSNQTRKRGLAYGSKCIKKEKFDHKRELENVSKMKELRYKGFSYHKIASIFNSMKIPTKTRKGKWHSKTIYQILQQEDS